MLQITFDDLVYIHDRIIEVSGGLAGIKDEGVIHSALARPFQSAFGKELHPTVYAKAAALLESIANNHGFNDGNKRTAMAVAIFFLYIQKLELSMTNEEYEDFMLHVVVDKPSIQEISTWLSQHCQPVR